MQKEQEQKRFSISESSLNLLVEQIDISLPATSQLIKAIISNDIKPIEEAKVVKDGEEK